MRASQSSGLMVPSLYNCSRDRLLHNHRVAAQLGEQNARRTFRGSPTLLQLRSVAADTPMPRASFSP
jgi:hypothetical protein